MKDGLKLDDYKWQKRLLLLFAPDRQDASYNMQLSLLEGEEAEMLKRDLLVVHLFNEEPGRLGDESLSKELGETLRTQFGIPAGGFKLLLLGKDGEVKRRTYAPITSEVLFTLIDAMPMRQREMAQGSP